MLHPSQVAIFLCIYLFYNSYQFTLRIIPEYTVQLIFNLCVFLEQEKSKLATMERRIRDATRLMSTDGTNDSNAKDNVSIGAGFSYYRPQTKFGAR